MLSISAFQINAWIAGFIWPLARILAFLSSEPIFSSVGIPARIRIGLGVALTILLVPMLPPPPPVAPASAMGLLILAGQILIGVTMGLALRMIFTALDLAGNLIGLQMGLGFATFYDPQHATQTAVIAQFFYLLACLLFFAINGHLQVIEVLANSFHTLPVSDRPLPADTFRMVAQWGANIFSWSLRISLPLVATLLMVNLALGVVSKAAQQLNLFSIGFPITLAVGMVMLILLLPYDAPVFEYLFKAGLNLADAIAGKHSP